MHSLSTIIYQNEEAIRKHVEEADRINKARVSDSAKAIDDALAQCSNSNITIKD